MHPFHSSVGLALAWGITTNYATPLSILDQLSTRQTFSLEEVEVERKTPWSAPHAIRDTYLKYGAEPPEYIEEAIRNAALPPPGGGQASAEARPIQGDKEYLISVQVGNHNLSLDLDTGSADLWVFSTLMPGNQRGNRPQARVYDVKGANAKQLQGHSWTIRYGDKSTANGQVFIDKVKIGSITVDKQAVEAAKSVSGSFSRDPANDGLLGLAFSKINTVKPTKQLTWFDNARSKLADPVFTCAIKRRKPGTYDFGYIDKAKYKGDIVWANVKGGKGLWDFTATGYAVGSGQVQTATINAVADTGSSLWYLPRAVADAYWKQVPGATFNQMGGGWTFPCTAKLPDMTMIVSGKRVSVPGVNMHYQTMSQTTCFGGIQRDVGMPFSIAGDVFLKNQFVIHQSDGKQAKLGFAQSSTKAT